MLHVIEEAVGVRIGQRSVLAPAFHIIAALHIVQPALLAPVRSRKGPSFSIELYAEGVPAALCEKLELMRHRMVAPNRLAQEMNAFDRRGAGASLRPIN